MSAIATWPSHAQQWLDDRGKAAWITLMVLGFIFFWPVGLALLFYMIWSNRMNSSTFGCSKRHKRHSFRSTGNLAFDSYKQETLKRLEEEQNAFHAFLDRLREAKDKTEFDEFMNDRARTAKQPKDEVAEA